jgi:hypothetical protein
MGRQLQDNEDEMPPQVPSKPSASGQSRPNSISVYTIEGPRCLNFKTKMASQLGVFIAGLGKPG